MANYILREPDGTLVTNKKKQPIVINDIDDEIDRFFGGMEQ